MKLYAISDLHVGYQQNRALLETLRPHLDDWLIIGGDVGESEEHLDYTLALTTSHFARVLWVPGNHELWTVRNDALRGVAKYERLVARCRTHGVLTPEDPYPTWPGAGSPTVLAPLFLLYDYTFRPDEVPVANAIAWARESGVLCADEHVLHPDPYPSRSAWCAARVAATAARLDAVPREQETVLINHFPLRRDLAILPAIPRFSIWCGTLKTEDWHLRYRARAVVSGHLHIRSTRWRDGVRFEEVSLGYPHGGARAPEIEAYLRQILPEPPDLSARSAAR